MYICLVMNWFFFVNMYMYKSDVNLKKKIKIKEEIFFRYGLE